MATVEISSWEDLSDINDALSGDYILTTDLDSDSTGYDTYASSTANSDAGWIPLETFTGTFDGDNHSISDIIITPSSGDNFGLFGICNEAELSNIGVKDISITTSGADDYVGGLASQIYSTPINNCYATGTISGFDNEIGGLVGYSFTETTSINNSYSIVNITGNGGSNYIAGFIGENYGSITNCYSVGTMSGTTSAGGFIDTNDGVITDCFYDSTISGQSDTGKGEPKTTAQMKDYDTFNDATWDIVLIGDYVDETWYIDDGTDYPRLGWEYVEPAATGTNLQVNIGDAWKNVDSLQINIGDAWKSVTAIKQNIGDAWKTVF